MNIEEAINQLGFGAAHPVMDQWLTKLAITQRPEFEENPAKWIDQKEAGYVLIFDACHSYQSTWGPVTGPGSMALSGVRVYSADNTKGFVAFEGDLPPGFHFNLRGADAKAMLGTPDFDDEEDEDDEEWILGWNKATIANKKATVYMVFDRKSGKMKAISFAPVMLKHQ